MPNTQTRDLSIVTHRLELRQLRFSDFAACRTTQLSATLTAAERNGGLLAVSCGDEASFKRLVRYRRTLAVRGEAYLLCAFVRESGALVGEVMLYEIRRGRRQDAIFGAITYVVHRRQGYAQESMRAVIRAAFSRLRLHRIEGEADPANHASLAMCRKLGFRKEGLSIRRVKEGGRWQDRVLLSITREEAKVAPRSMHQRARLHPRDTVHTNSR